ncbi:unnamed protein product [Cyclocybe aegerita]|uniref:Uncharacterized protein n=1 Tax=Cyclocybe aegerita TaxID=1973307 RepID=A0A8S0WA42_CYCAE|nr:unnamed protein product [Cyclocybe aegerita]
MSRLEDRGLASIGPVESPCCKTNITEPARNYNTSRGSLVSSFLLSQSSHPLEDEVGKIVPEDANYAGFNLLLFAPSPSLEVDRSDASSMPIHYDALLVTNHGGGGTLTSRPFLPNERVCGGISNGVDGAGADPWPKVQHATQDFGDAVRGLPAGASEAELTEHLFNLLAWHPPQAIVHRSELRNTVHVLPVPIILDGPASTHPTPSYYGTRLSTVLLVRKDGEAVFIERDIWQLEKDEDGKERPVRSDPPTERRFRFKLQLDGSVT